MTDAVPKLAPLTGPPPQEAGLGYAATARVVGPVPARGSWVEEPELPDPMPVPPGLGALLPGGAAGLALPLALAVLRPDLRRWLGEPRLAEMARMLDVEPKLLLATLAAAPPPPASLGEAALWSGQRVPLQGAGWAELFWRPDRGSAGQGRHAARGTFAIRLALPATGRIELRGRLEDRRLDAVMESARPLPRLAALAVEEAYAAVLARLGLAGDLTLRHMRQDRRP
jgi:hypothetical protein